MIEQLKADPRTAPIPVIAWSGSDAEEGETEAMRAGAAAYFEKRDLKGLVSKIAELVWRQ